MTEFDKASDKGCFFELGNVAGDSEDYLPRVALPFALRCVWYEVKRKRQRDDAEVLRAFRNGVDVTLSAILDGKGGKMFEYAVVLATATKLHAHRLVRASTDEWWPPASTVAQSLLPDVNVFGTYGFECTNALFPKCTVLSGDLELINALAFRVGRVVSNENVLVVQESLWSTTWTIDTSMKATWAGNLCAKTTALSSGMLVHSSDTNMKAIDAALYLTTTDGTPHLVLLQMKHSDGVSTLSVADVKKTATMTDKLLDEVLCNKVSEQRVCIHFNVPNKQEHPFHKAGIQDKKQVTLCIVSLWELPGTMNADAFHSLKLGFNMVILDQNAARAHFGAAYEYVPFLEWQEKWDELRKAKDAQIADEAKNKTE